MTETFKEDDSAIRRLRAGGLAELASLIEENRDRLRKCVFARVDRRMQSRLDESDVIQETFVEASRRLDDYLANPSMPAFLWLRYIAQQHAQALYNHHLKQQKRSAGREAATGDPAVENLLLDLSQAMVSPHSQLVRSEVKQRLYEVLLDMSDGDREILTLVHLEGLSVAEASDVLNITQETGRKRHFRAMKRLKVIIEEMEFSLS